MSVSMCKDCGAVISATDVKEWNDISPEKKASSSSQSRQKKQCQRCYNSNNGRTLGR